MDDGYVTSQPVDQGKVRPEALGEPDNAQRESDALELHRLETKRKRREHERSELLKTIFAAGTNLLLWTAFLLVWSAMITVSWHYLTPSSWHWLEKTALDAITTTIFSGSLLAFLGLYVRDRLRN